jgi:hypothetical protein
MDKSIDTKLEKIRRGQYKPSDFIIADTKGLDKLVSMICVLTSDILMVFTDCSIFIILFG